MSSIIARNVTIDLPIFDNSHRSIKKRLLNASSGGRFAERAGGHLSVRALDNLSFEFKSGERIGLVGPNGSGKSTLLRALVGAYSPSNGDIKIQGRIASLLDLSLGIDPDATGYENIFLRGLISGMTKDEIQKNLDSIADFTELGDYLNLPVRSYSSGMQVRLAFAVCTSVHADIIIMDEWLSVGDAKFNEKAAAKLRSLIDRASILVIASHSEDLIKSVCTRALELSRGKIVRDYNLQL